MAHSDRSGVTIPRDHTYARSTGPSGSSSTNESLRGLTTTSRPCCRTQSADSVLCAVPLPRFSHRDFATPIPVELLDNILFYVTWGYQGGSLSGGHTVFPRWCRPEVTACSLVCRRWADRCRQYLFFGTILIITSNKEARRLVHYALYGCPSLVPLHTLISGIRVHQRYSDSYPFLYRISLLTSVARKLLESSYLKIEGPVQEELPMCKLNTPHWNIPPSIPTPPSLLAYREIRLVDIHLPSFMHAAKYIDHFRSAAEVYLDKLTWRDDESHASTWALGRVRKGNFYKLLNRHFRFRALDCTDTARISLQSLITNIRSPLYAISDDSLENERDIVLSWLQGFCRGRPGNIVDRMQISCEYDVRNSPSEGPILMFRIDLQINNCASIYTLEDRAPKGSPTPTFRVVGFHAQWKEDSKGVTLEHMTSHLQRFRYLHAVAIEFVSYEEMKSTMSKLDRPLAPFLPPPTDHQYYVLAIPYDPCIPLVTPLDYYVGIDPETLLPTGQAWTKEEEIVPSLLRILGP